MAVGDLNGDGKPDIVVTQSNGMVVLLNKGDGTFGTATYYDNGLNNNSEIPMLQGNGDGTFTSLGEPEYQWVNGQEGEVFKGGSYVGPTSRSALVGDFNGDGTQDIAVLNADNFAISDSVTFATVLFNSTQPVSLSPLTLNFGTVAVGATKSLTVLLTNDQNTTLTINSIAVASATGDFTATHNCGKSQKAGFDCTITVKFKPSVLGVQTGTLTITDSAGTQTVALIAVNPKPTITSLSPSSATHGGAGFTLTVDGAGFINNSVVNWAGSPRSTIYGSSTEITATITAADIAKAGSFKVTVTNPVPGGGTSAATTFTVN
jgi:hypothetical protein